MKYFTTIGNHDAIEPNREGFGAALTIFFNYKEEIDGVYIFTTPDNPKFPYKQTADKTKRRMKMEKIDLPVSVIEMDLDNPVNFDLVYKVMLDETQNVIEADKIRDKEKIINITSGTPTMTTCWVLLQKSGLILHAKLIQSFEQKYQRKYGKTCQEVDLEIDDFPEIKATSAIKRELNRTKAEVQVLKDEKETSDLDVSIPSLVGSSKAIRLIKDKIIHDIDDKTHVLILGETGTGKEEVANAIWDIHRKEIDKELIGFDCGQFNKSELITSELFGYEKGAFTGANRDKRGIIEECNGRMLFLDEIGNIPYNNQSVLLRFLQGGEWRRVGSTKINKSQIQVVAATNVDVNNPELFRQDLRNRFDEVIQIPPLRERREDIRDLVQYFILVENQNVSFDESVYKALMHYSWPDNVRQLQKWVERICRRFKNIRLTWDEIPDHSKPDEMDSLGDDMDLPEIPIDSNRLFVELRLKAIEMANNNYSEADRLLSLKVGTIKQWMHHREKRKRK